MRISDWSSDVCSSDLTEEMVGGGRGVVRFVVVVLAHGMLRRFDRDPRGLHGDESRRAARPYTRSKAEGRSTAEEDEGGIFCFAMERPEGPPENSSPQALTSGGGRVGREYVSTGRTWGST